VQGVVILLHENTVLLQKIYRWTGVEKVLEILSWISEMTQLVIDEPEMYGREYCYIQRVLLYTESIVIYREYFYIQGVFLYT
jgi:hypothetical protein